MRLAVAAAVCVLLTSGCQHSAIRPAGAARAADAAAATPYLFGQAAAWSDLTTQCSYGPRDPRLPAHAKCLRYILAQLKPVCDAVTTQNFPYTDTDRKVTLHLTNVFGVINPTATPRIMISAHWDTRPTADNDLDIANRSKPILGADDGASGVAALLELARALHHERPHCGIVLAFWDGEDWGPGEDKMYLGSEYFADHPGPLRPDQSILLDMIGQQGLEIDREAWSQSNYPSLVNAVWKAAAEAGQSDVFRDVTGEEIIDDQIPLAKLREPSIDVIDFDYAYWHTLEDTPQHCDPKSLEAVGVTLEQYIRDIDAATKAPSASQ